MIPKLSAGELKKIFARNLNHLIESRGRRVSDIAADLDIPYMTVSDWTKGKNMPRMDKIEMLANYFKVSKAELIEEQKESAPATGEGLSEFESKYSVLSDESKAMVRERIQTLFEKENPPKT